jgi:serine/threonine-protein kinase
MQQLLPSTALQGGKYRIERVLGQGGFGITYLARNIVFDTDVAIKEFFMKDENNRDGSLVTMPNSTKTELFVGQMEKFKKEAKRMFSIRNEHIIGVHDLFEENGTAYYVMDYIDGENLAERLKRTGKPMTESEIRQILPQILDALKSVHDAGIWHLDLKPANIMVDKAGKVKLIDFGASKQLNVQKGGATTSTAISYTNGYAPREQMEQNYDKFGPWTDYYALGATIYSLLTNKRPPLPTDIDDDLSADKHTALPFPNGISSEMHSYVLKLMNTNRLLRPQNSKEAAFTGELAQNRTDFVKSKESSSIFSEETIIAGNIIKDDNKQEAIAVHSQSSKKMWFVICICFAVLILLAAAFSNSIFSGNQTLQAPVVDTDSIEEVVDSVPVLDIDIPWEAVDTVPDDYHY